MRQDDERDDVIEKLKELADSGSCLLCRMEEQEQEEDDD